ncbi:MAG: hypothetical protein OEW45_12215 [Deltaproteobacteria bacterium]|nr:hypothetical protein [Deltaproteobacteria bacterium]
MNYIFGVYMNHVATDGVDSAGICPHDDGPHGEGGRRKHHFLSSYNRINRYEFRLDDLLKVGYLVFEEDIMVHKSMSIILNTDKVFET